MSQTTTKRAQLDNQTDFEINLKFEPATELELKAIGDNLPDGYVAGWASTPDRDSADHVVLPGAFDESIRMKGLVGPKAIRLLLHHDWTLVPGVIKVLDTRNGRLWIEAQLDLEISYARDAYLAAKAVGGLNFSVGFRRQESRWVMIGDWGDDDFDEYLEISKADLWEVSVVTFPANTECTMDFIKQQPIESLADFERSLVAQGIVKTRNEARRVTLAVKSAGNLFAVKPPEVKDPPRLADEGVKTIQAKLDALRAKMAPVAANS